MEVRSFEDVISFVCTSWQIRMHVRLGGLTIQTGSDDLDNTLNRGVRNRRKEGDQRRMSLRKKQQHTHTQKRKMKKKLHGGPRRSIKIRVREKTEHNRSIRA